MMATDGQRQGGGRDKQSCFTVRPFLIQSDMSVENGRFRLTPKSDFLTQSKKGFFDSTLFDREFRLADPAEKLDLFDWILQSKNSVQKVLPLFFQPIASLIPPQNKHRHAYTPIPGSIIQQRRLSLLLLLAVSQRGALLAPLASSVYHTTAAARDIGAILPTTGTPAVALTPLG